VRCLGQADHSIKKANAVNEGSRKSDKHGLQLHLGIDETTRKVVAPVLTTNAVSDDCHAARAAGSGHRGHRPGLCVIGPTIRATVMLSLRTEERELPFLLVSMPRSSIMEMPRPRLTPRRDTACDPRDRPRLMGTGCWYHRSRSIAEDAIFRNKAFGGSDCERIIESSGSLWHGARLYGRIKSHHKWDSLETVRINAKTPSCTRKSTQGKP